MGRAVAEVEVPAMGCCVRGDGAFGKGGLKVALNIELQVGDVQSSLEIVSRSIRTGGIGSGLGRACGKREEKSCKLFLDRASARVLFEPGI